MPPVHEARRYLTPFGEGSHYLPEGPREVTLRKHPALAWVNIQDGPDATTGSIQVHYTTPGMDRFVMPAPERPGFFLPTSLPQVVLVGLGKTLRHADLLEGQWSEPLATIPDDNLRTIINDAEIVPGGEAVVFGTKDTKFADPIASLYLYTPADDRVTVLRDGQTCSNGKVFTRDDRGLILFDIDTPTKTVTRNRLDVETRTLTPDGIAIELRHESAFPDGMCDCGDGTVIVAFYNPDFAAFGRAVRYRLADGEPLEEWHTPGSPRVTCPLLVQRNDGVKLILTTATEGMPAEMRTKCPNAGCLFIADTSLTGIPPAEVVKLI